MPFRRFSFSGQARASHHRLQESFLDRTHDALAALRVLKEEFQVFRRRCHPDEVSPSPRKEKDDLLCAVRVLFRPARARTNPDIRYLLSTKSESA